VKVRHGFGVVALARLTQPLGESAVQPGDAQRVCRVHAAPTSPTPERAIPQPATIERMAGPTRRARIAVINDDTAFLELMRDLLENEENYDVLICREWNSAYQFVRDERPDLVIQDIRIGGEEHGWTILNLLTLDPLTRPIPTIVCSAAIQSLHEHQEMLDRYGIYALPKPFDLDALLTAVSKMLRQSPERPSTAD
jgi:CheY-like chemotaxis protein